MVLDGRQCCKNVYGLASLPILICLWMGSAFSELISPSRLSELSGGHSAPCWTGDPYRVPCRMLCTLLWCLALLSTATSFFPLSLVTNLSAVHHMGNRSSAWRMRLSFAVCHKRLPSDVHSNPTNKSELWIWWLQQDPWMLYERCTPSVTQAKWTQNQLSTHFVL